MDKNRALEILEALASGCSPTTGEVIINDSVLNERNVIRALQIAIENLKRENQNDFQQSIVIDETIIKSAIELFNENKRGVSDNSLTGFFLGTRNFKNKNLISNPLYGKFKDEFTKGQLLDFFNQYLTENNLTKKRNHKYELYKEIDFFEKEIFNTLSDKAIEQLKEKITDIGVLKTENLSESVQNSRINHPRAYETWSEAEIELLRKAIKYTNDLDLLSKCFQRGKGSIKSYGQRIIYESKNS